MLMQFIVLGIHRRNQEPDAGPEGAIVFDVIVDGEVVETCRMRGTALVRLAEEIDKKIGR